MNIIELKRILHIEDDPDIQGIVRLALEPITGVEIESCANAKEGLSRLVTFRPDLLLLDVMLPDASGLSVFEALRSSPATRHVPVVFMTAQADAATETHYRQIGAAGVIKKPFDFRTLASDVRSIWAACPSLAKLASACP